MKVAPQRIAQIESRFAELEIVDVAAKIRMTKISASLRLCVNLFYCHSRAGGNPWRDLSEIGFARRQEDTKKLLRVFVSLCEPKSSRMWKHQTMDPRLRGDDNIGFFGDQVMKISPQHHLELVSG